MAKKETVRDGSGGDDLGQFYGGNPPGDIVIGDDGGNLGGDGGGGGERGDSGGSGGDGSPGDGGGNLDPRTALGGDGGSGPSGDVDDDRYIRNDDGSIALSPTGRKRRRRRGSAPGGAKETKAKLSVSSVEAILLSSHQMLAQLTNVQSLAIGKQKADMLATGIVNVARHYPTGALDPKMVDWFNLFMALGICYQPVAAEVRDNMRAQAAERRGRGRTNGGPVAVPDQPFVPTAPEFDAGPLFDGPLDPSTIKPGPIQGR